MIIVVLLILGLAAGSFVNALIWRLHEQSAEEGKKRPDKSYLQQLSVTRGRSMCPQCKHQLAAKDLVPLFSWLSLGGKCRYCAKPIGRQYPLVEALTALLFVFSYHYWPYSLHAAGLLDFIIWLPILTGLIALAVYDLKWFLLPDKVVATLLGFVVLQITANLIWFSGGSHLLKSSLWGLLIGGGLFFGLFQLSKGSWIGGGDVKLGGLLGLLLGGPWPAVLLLFLASLGGSLISVPLLAAGKAKRDTHIPFGPFLIAAAIVVQLFGVSMTNWLRGRYLIP